MSKENTYVGVHGESLRRRALEHPDSPLARDLVMAASWIDALNQRIQNQSESVALPELIEAADPIAAVLDELSDQSKKYASAVMVDADLLRALHSALAKAKGGET